MSMISCAVRGLARSQAMRPSLAVFSRNFCAKKEFPEDIDHATGLEKRELVAMSAGNKDPFDMEPYKRGAGTKEQPNLIPSILEKRMIGCICEEDSTCINYMWLHKSEPKRCECGHWFKLVDGKFI